MVYAVVGCRLRKKSNTDCHIGRYRASQISVLDHEGYESVSKTPNAGSSPARATKNFSAECDRHDFYLMRTLGLPVEVAET